jgi:H+/Cl- antiporter ClcA
VTLLRKIIFPILLSIPVALITGSVAAFFLWSLDQVTKIRFENPLLLYLLPVAGIISVFFYYRYGKNLALETDLILTNINDPTQSVPLRITPMIVGSTLLTHLCGGSAGREGTALQIGGGLAEMCLRVLKIHDQYKPIILMSGLAAGFGAVFGTPIAAAIFTFEILRFKKTIWHDFIPVINASVGAHFICLAWGAQHTDFLRCGLSAHGFAEINFSLLGKVMIAGLLFGVVGRFYLFLKEQIGRGFEKLPRQPYLQPIVGGTIIIGLTYIIDSRDYLGLGISAQHADGISILSSFHDHGATAWSWLWKMIFTVITLQSGFKGGEVTPLFFIGATLGNFLATIFHAPTGLFAGLGLIAVFSGVARTPIACAVIGMEIFGAHHAIYMIAACFCAVFSQKKIQAINNTQTK